MKTEIINAIEKYKLIAILRNIPKEKLIDTAYALYNGGIRLVEVTFDATGKTSNEATAEYIKILADEFKNKMHIGAGTVLTKKQVMLTSEAGGSFIISPNTDKSVIKLSAKKGLVSIPGALTPTEITDAKKYGADFVKLFPITNLGVDYVKAVSAPLSHIKFLAVGGINLNNMASYLDAGICGFGLGSNIADKKLIEENNFDGITELAKKYVAVINGG